MAVSLRLLRLGGSRLCARGLGGTRLARPLKQLLGGLGTLAKLFTAGDRDKANCLSEVWRATPDDDQHYTYAIAPP